MGKNKQKQKHKQQATREVEKLRPKRPGIPPPAEPVKPDQPLRSAPETEWEVSGPLRANETAIALPVPGNPKAAEAAVEREWQVGDVILDLYEVRGVLGTGGFGKVYRVHHTGWNIDLAVKTPRVDRLDEAGKASFRREAETWVNLGLHPHTVSCYYVRDLGGIPRVFAEYVEGGSLADWIRDGRLYEGGPELALERILDIAIQFAWGLHYAHEQGLVHQDVKPANVMMTPDGSAKVTDFGLARSRSNTRGEGATASAESVLVDSGAMTPAYASPEQSSGQRLSRATDIWSWGVSILEMFAGGLFWTSGSWAAEVLDEFTGDSDDPSLPSLPPRVRDLLRACFAADPSHRALDLGRIADELQTIYGELIGRRFTRQQPQVSQAIADGINNRAASLVDLGRVVEAEQLWDQALQIQPHHLESTYNQGLVRWRLGQADDQDLLSALEEAERSLVDRSKSNHLIGLMRIGQGYYEAAIDELNRALGGMANDVEIAILMKQAEQLLSHSRKRLHTLTGHTRQVLAVAISPDGKRILSGSDDATVKLWDRETAECLRTFEGHSDGVSSISCSPDGRHLLSGSFDMTAKLWDLESGKCVHTFTGHEREVKSVHIGADGRFAVTGSVDTTVLLWDLANGKYVRTFDNQAESSYSHVSAVRLTADGRFVLSASDHDLYLWEVDSGRFVRRFEGHGARVTSVSLSADGKYILSGGDDRTVKHWELETGKCLRTITNHKTIVNAVELSGDGKHALSGDVDGNLKLWELSTGRCVRTFKDPVFRVGSLVNRINAVGLDRDKKYGVTGSLDGTIKLWSLEVDHVAIAPLAVCRITASEESRAVQQRFSKLIDEAQTAIAQQRWDDACKVIREARSLPGYSRDPRALDLWSKLYAVLRRTDLKGAWEHSRLTGHAEYVESVCISPDSKFALTGSKDETVRLWDVETGECLRTLKGHTWNVRDVTFGSDGRFALSGSNDGDVRLWKLETGKCVRVFEGQAWVSTVALSPSGDLALSGSGDDRIHLWEMASGKCLRSYECNGFDPTSVCFSPDDRYVLLATLDHTLDLWELETGIQRRAFVGHSSAVVAAKLRADGKFALSGSSDKTVKLWDVGSALCIRTFEGHAEMLTSVGFSADGRYGISGSYDKTMKLWEIDTGRCLRTFTGHTSSVLSVALSENGKYAISASLDNSVRVWFLDWDLEGRGLSAPGESAFPTLKDSVAEQTPIIETQPAAEPALEFRPESDIFQRVREYARQSAELKQRSFELCTRCGNQVQPYRCREFLDHDEAWNYEKPLPGNAETRVSENEYWCSSCAARWPAFGVGDTSRKMACGHFLPFYVEICPICGPQLLLPQDDSDKLEIQYRCVDCGKAFAIAITEREQSTVLDRDHHEKCAKCGQEVGLGQVTCRQCGTKFDLEHRHAQVGCDLANGACPNCKANYLSLCVC